MKKRYVKLNSITIKKVDNAYDFQVQDIHRIIAKTPDSKTAFLTSNCALDASHPQIKDFITIKQQSNRLTKFNLSILIPDRFMRAVQNDDVWKLQFPDTNYAGYKDQWHGDLERWITEGKPTLVYEELPARELWDLIMLSTYNRNEPGVLFYDNINDYHPVNYAEKILTTNPCIIGDTMIATMDENQNIIPIKIADMVGKQYDVLSIDKKGDIQIKKARDIRKTRENSELVRVKLIGGESLITTPNHRFISPVSNERGVLQGVYDLTRQDWIKQAKDLKHGDYIPKISSKLFSDDFFPECISSYRLVQEVQVLKQKEDVYNMTVDDNHNYGVIIDGDIIFIKNCGEIPQASNVCNLAHINLTRFYNKEDNSFDFEQFSQVVQNGVFFLDNVCEIGNVPLEEYNQKIQDYRKIGLGVMGLGSLLMMMGIKFGSYQAIELTKKIFKTKAQIELLTSAMIGKFKGSFGKFDPEKYYNTKWWLELDIDYVVKRNIQNAGAMRNSVHSSVAPTGNCVVKNTVIRTSKGRKRIQDIFRQNKIILNQNLNIWYTAIEDIQVQTLDGYKKIIRLYNNQYSQELYKITTTSGKMIEGTGFHKLLVRGDDGLTSWKKLQDFKVGDFILIRQNQSIGQMELKEQQIIDIDKTNGFTYDIQVQDNHHYILQNGIISHNSSLFSGQVSNGIEPVFMKEYTRWVVMTKQQKEQLQQQLQQKLPDPTLGQWFETNVFKFALRGDEQILRGQVDGKVYEIDKNRGLVKSMQVRDYGWNYILQNDLSDKGVVEIDELTVQQHLNMLAASGKYINQNQSKTINIPQDYSYEDFKNVYMQAWKRKIKGITTYRAGTMTAVIEKKKTDQQYQSQLEKLYKLNEDGVIFSDVKIPNKSYALQFKVKDKNRKKWYFTICFADKELTIPFALFIRTNNRESNQVTDAIIKSMQQLLLKAGIKEELIQAQRQKYAGQTNVDKIGRAIGMALRHNVPLVDIVDTLQTQADGLSTLLFHVKKLLSQYIKDGTKVSDKLCDQCGLEAITYQGGCQVCANCGYSRCS